jgi:glycosyltransferase involved in cell wall biosynthesis
MRICFIGDARSVHTQRWVRWFAGEHEVGVIATADPDGLEDLCVEILPERTTRGTRLLHSVRAVRGALARFEPDVVHAHFINEAGWLAAAARRRPFVITAWGSDVYRAPHESRLARHLNPRSVRAADHVTCDSHDQARILRSWGVPDAQLDVVGWGVDRQEFHPGIDGSRLRAELSIPLDAKVILSPRQWLPNSSIEAIVRAHALLGGDAHLILKRAPAFETDGGRAVQAAIDASSQRDRIHVVGYLPAAQLPGLYAAADVVVSLCITDGTPVSVLESMAIGCPIVAYANASLAEWVSEPGGCLVGSTDPRAVAEALSRWLDADSEDLDRARTHNLSVIAERADRSTELRRMDDIYRHLRDEAAAHG